MNLRQSAASVFAAILFGNLSPVSASAGDWQLSLLFEPPASQIDREARGRVMIYQGVTDKTVERALDEQFDRVEYMMFVGTVRTDETGQPLRDEDTGEMLVEDDGC